jgi:hypothetical protein
MRTHNTERVQESSREREREFKRERERDVQTHNTRHKIEAHKKAHGIYQTDNDERDKGEPARQNTVTVRECKGSGKSNEHHTRRRGDAGEALQDRCAAYLCNDGRDIMVFHQFDVKHQGRVGRNARWMTECTVRV